MDLVCVSCLWTFDPSRGFGIVWEMFINFPKHGNVQFICYVNGISSFFEVCDIRFVMFFPIFWTVNTSVHLNYSGHSMCCLDSLIQTSFFHVQLVVSGLLICVLGTIKEGNVFELESVFK